MSVVLFGFYLCAYPQPAKVQSLGAQKRQDLLLLWHSQEGHFLSLKEGLLPDLAEEQDQYVALAA